MRFTKEACKKLCLPFNGATAEGLPPVVIERLSKAGVTTDEWLELSAMVLQRWEKEKKKEARMPPRATRKPLPIHDDDIGSFVEAQECFLQHLSTYRALFPTIRDNWDAWLDASGEDLSLDDKAFCAIYIMIMTPNTNDKAVEPVVLDMMRGGITSAKKMMDEFACGAGVKKCLSALSLRIRKAGKHNMNASYFIQAALVCIMNGCTPNTYVDLKALMGVGMKIADVVMNEVYGIVTGIPCDVHMIRMFNAVGWADGKGDDVPMQLMSWLPKCWWLGLNKTFAGMGQLLQSGNEDKAKFISLMKDDAPEDWIWDQMGKILDLDEYKK